MDEGILGQYKQFFRTGAGQDLVDRLKTTEAKYLMEGMQAIRSKNTEAAALSMAQAEATNAIRTMVEDLAQPLRPKPIKSKFASGQPTAQTGRK